MFESTATLAQAAVLSASSTGVSGDVSAYRSTYGEPARAVELGAVAAAKAGKLSSELSDIYSQMTANENLRTKQGLQTSDPRYLALLVDSADLVRQGVQQGVADGVVQKKLGWDLSEDRKTLSAVGTKILLDRASTLLEGKPDTDFTNIRDVVKSQGEGMTAQQEKELARFIIDQDPELKSTYQSATTAAADRIPGQKQTTQSLGSFSRQMFQTNAQMIDALDKMLPADQAGGATRAEQIVTKLLSDPAMKQLETSDPAAYAKAKDEKLTEVRKLLGGLDFARQAQDIILENLPANAKDPHRLTAESSAAVGYFMTDLTKLASGLGYDISSDSRYEQWKEACPPLKGELVFTEQSHRKYLGSINQASNRGIPEMVTLQTNVEGGIPLTPAQEYQVLKHYERIVRGGRQ